MQRVIARSTRTEPTLYFNYVTERNREWKSCDLQRQLKFGVVYGKSETEPLVVDL